MAGPTIHDVARAAGVSSASASRALSGAAAVSPELTWRIRAAAARLGYVPNLSARALATNRPGLVGALVQTIADPAMAEIFTACEGRLATSGYALAIGFAGKDPVPAAEALLGRGIGALFLADIGVSPAVRDAVSKRRVLCMHLGAGPDGVTRLGIGRREGAALAARYLENLGHRVLAVLAHSGNEMISAARDALDNASTVLGVVPRGPTLEAARAAIRPVLCGDDPPTALICETDAIAFAALRECLGCRIEVPRRLSVVGFGDTELSRHSWPALSTVRIDSAELGRRLADAVVARLEGRDAPFAAASVKLIVRESTGPAGRP